MTWSIIARDRATSQLGIALATRFFAAGALVPFISAGVGAVATQALVNPYYGIDGLRMLREGRSAEETLQLLTKADDGREYRQVHIMDANGRSSCHTGKACIGWCGHLGRDDLSVAGNMLAGQTVLEDTVRAYDTNATRPFPQRMIAAMQAGETAGGDARGKQSAALLIAGEHEWLALDLRVDDHADPLAELARLERVSHREWLGFRQFVPTRACPAGFTDYAVLEAESERTANGLLGP
jgi:uncharacterized Ntn-hydrolase superfamily protein